MSGHSFLQAGKGAVAAVVAWLLADGLWDLPQPFLAPYAAVFMIESTVYRSIRGSAQQLAAASTAVLVAFLVLRLIPEHAVALGVAVAVGLLVGRWSVFGESGKWIGVTVVLVLTVTGASQEVMLLDRLLETALGAVTGTLVNSLVFPPTYDRWARRTTAELGAELRAVLVELADALRAEGGPRDPSGWVRRTRGSEEWVRRAEEAVRWNAEAIRLNVRTRPGRAGGRAVNLREAWPRVVQIAEAVQSCADDGPVTRYPSPRSRADYAALLDELAAVIDTVNGPEDDLVAAVDRARERIAALDSRLTGSVEESDASRGLAAMLLPARLVLDALTRRPTPTTR
ncbi:aromatic acid exporter family protein [Actinokineospora auranticolor]|uniref:Aromatic acid exporter family member 1 n=1 Tax=Actinokineospora auranticolor TaxID=155976 RepID=A0A2S6GLJ8_9PSEU|nr:aromatic acid exporter family protein [Actinokineospora auranticolor]PPK66095.1 aromatic acid exporter family member 1 [Actinokineospora auranticolor]